MPGVAAALLALLAVHPAPAARLEVRPAAFSPRVGVLHVNARLSRRALVGLRLGGHSWLMRPARRTRISYDWHGRVNGRLVPDGRYQLQVVLAKKVLARAWFRLDATAPSLSGLRVSNGGHPFAGDNPLLATISPGAASDRIAARIAFSLAEPARVTLRVQTTDRRRHAVTTEMAELGRGSHTFVWAPAPGTPARTYLLLLTATDAVGNRHRYGARTAYTVRYLRAPAVRVLGIDAFFDRQSYAPGEAASLRVATDAPSFTLRLFHAPGPKPSPSPDALTGTPVTDPQEIQWASHEDAPATIRLAIGDWPSGLYYAELDGSDGRVGYAPFVIRPAELGALSRIAVVLPTNTWQAYNFWDADGDGWGDTWYAGRNDLRVTLDRPYLNRGVPPKINRYEIPFLTWMARAGLTADVLSERDLDAVESGRTLADRYDLIVFPGHTEYVTAHEYDLVEQYRDAGGNLIFLSANNFFRRVFADDGVLTRLQPWRALGRPEAALLGAQYRANDEGQHQEPFVVRNTKATPWLWQGLGLDVGALFGRVVGGFGIEIDATTRDSPPGTIVLAEIPNLLGPAVTAQMTYYETPAGAKVFDAGALDFVGSVLTYPVNHLLFNLWRHLAVP